MKIPSYVEKVLDRLHEKGFEAYPYTRKCDLWKTPLSQPWAKKFGGVYKGSLHVRVN